MPFILGILEILRMPPPNKRIKTAVKNVRNYFTNILMFIYIYHL